jgi:peptide/nickel transport system ATP-binding protein
MIFQDPLMTLNPVLTIGEQMAEAVLEHRPETEAKALALAGEALARVGIPAASDRLRQYPHEFSGGMRQRVAIATALINQPDLIIADEPTTALDVTIQGQILFEVQKLARETGAALIWITHDLTVVAELADRIAVMYAGRIVEVAPSTSVIEAARHPYTRALLAAVPEPDPANRLRTRPVVAGEPPDPGRLPPGCAFHPRCPLAIPGTCDVVEPPLLAFAGGHQVACHLYPAGDPDGVASGEAGGESTGVAAGPASGDAAMTSRAARMPGSFDSA